MSPKVSVIVPVYNVAEYLGQCLDTILLQTLQDIEVICVDDGSTDNSLEILNTYAFLDERIKVIHQENAGPGAARNRGMKDATGEFVIFLDSDDFFHPEMLEKMVAKAEEDESDVVVCGVTFFDDTTQQDIGEEIPDSHFLTSSPIIPKEHFNDLFFCRAWMWQKLIRHSLLTKNDLQFPDFKFQEDIPFSYTMMALANKISLVPDTLVHYRLNVRNSLITKSKESLPNYCLAWEVLWNNLKKHHLEKYFKEAFQEVFFREVRYSSISYRKNEEKKLILNRFITDLEQDIQTTLFDIGNGKIKISLIICTYNGAEFLSECLDSCLNQTLKEIEIICVDDGSTDDTLKILNDYTEKDNRIKVIHQKNQGLPISRNNAMKIANGEYIQFVDADDWIEPDTCECLYLYAKIYDLDMLSFAAKEFKNETRQEFDEPYHCLKWLPENFEPVFTWQQISNVLPQLAVTSPLTIYRHQYLLDQDITWINKKVAYEDTPFFIESLLKGARMGALPIHFYHKRVHEAAITQNMDTNFPDYCWICGYTLKKIHEQIGDSAVFIQYLYTFMNKIYLNYEKLDNTVQERMLAPLYKFCFSVLKRYHMPLSKEMTILCQGYLENKNMKKKMGFSLYTLVAKWRQSGYAINPIRFSMKPLFLSIFGKILFFKNNIYVPKLHKKQMPEKDRFILCFDSLSDSNAECIDAYTFFKWLQKNKIPSKYIIHPANPLAKKISDKRDVILSDAHSFFINCTYILSKSKCVITSFGLHKYYNHYIKKLSWIKYIFIDHGAILLKHSVLNFYTEKDFHYICANFKPEHQLYSNLRLWKNRQILCGMPRWDNLKKVPHSNKNIFIFFTWRMSIQKYSAFHTRYEKRILKFLNSQKLVSLLRDGNITLNIASHHAMVFNDGKIKFPKYINLIQPTEISKIIQSTDLMITDYSSLAYDFMFLDIPVIFYRFDTDVRYPDKRDRLDAKSAKSHDKELYNVFYDEDSVLKKIEFYIKNNFVLEPEYKKINDSLFWEKENICEHLYEKINSL